MWANLERIAEKRGRTGKIVGGDTLQGGGVTPEWNQKSDSDEQKKSPVFQEKNKQG